MPTNYYWPTLQGAIGWFTHELNQQLGAQLKVLLETKHLYQKVCVDPDPIEREVLAHVESRDLKERVERTIQKLRRTRLLPVGGTELRSVPAEGGQEIVDLCLVVLNVRLFCTQCDEKNVFRPIWYQDVGNELMRPSRIHDIDLPTADMQTNQLFFLALLCQHCHHLPEGFLIRRRNWDLFLEGRSPMERIDVPHYIPKKEARLFRDAMIVWHAGKPLGAVFYLRSFIEQFARRQTGKLRERKTGDEIMDAYAECLPLDKRPNLPSLKHWYDKLSEPIHSAEDEAAERLFDNAREEIEHHFELRRALRISDQEAG
jgi:hypothetical protein